MRSLLLTLALLGAACHGPGAGPAPEVAPPQEEVDSTEDSTEEPTEERSWSVNYRFPVWVGITELHLGEGTPFDSLASLSVVPTVEFVRPLSDEWTLLPFVGAGMGWLINEGGGVLILTTGVRAEWLHRINERSVVRVLPRLRYDANLNRPDGLLGDWGRADLALEVRRTLGEPGDAVRWEPGIYAQGFWFWDDIEFDVPGISPDTVHNQLEVGLSLGMQEPIEVWGLPLPKIFLGLRSGDGIETITLRLGEL